MCDVSSRLAYWSIINRGDVSLDMALLYVALTWLPQDMDDDHNNEDDAVLLGFCDSPWAFLIY